jgi:hypothetical protein
MMQSKITELTNNELRCLLKECDELSSMVAPATVEMSPTLKGLFDRCSGYLWGAKFCNLKEQLVYEAVKRFKNEEINLVDQK